MTPGAEAPTEPIVTRRPAWAPMTAAAAAAAAATAWIGAVILTAGHGFNVGDEGFYLLSYRWWNTNLRTFTGIQYLYGPVFQLFGYDIAALRLFRLLTVVGVHAVFGWTFMCWLRLRRPTAPESRWWEIAGTAVVVACGGMVYSWLPLSPGYNDVSLLGALLFASIVLRIATYVDRGLRVPAWVPAALGPVVVATVLAKWASTALTLVIVSLVGIAAVAPRGRREVLRTGAWALAGAAVTTGLIHVLVVPLTKALPQMLTVNKLAAAQTNSPFALLRMYATTTWAVVETIATRHTLLLVAAVAAVVLRGRLGRSAAAVLAVAGLAVSASRLRTDGDLHGGAINIFQFPVGILLMFVVALLVGVVAVLGGWFTGTKTSSLSRESPRTWAMYGMLALLPAAQAAGTGNPLYMMAVNAFAAWAALIIAVLTGIETTPAAARWLMAAVAAAAVALSAIIATDGLWSNPYRTSGRRSTTALAAGVPALGSLKLDPIDARSYSQLRSRLRPYIEPPGRAIMAFDEMPGIVLFLDGRPVGEAWYSATDHARTAAGIRAACEDGPGWWGTRLPILLFRRPISDTEIDALWACGLVFATDYRLLAPPAETMGLSVYVPAAEAAKGQ